MYNVQSRECIQPVSAECVEKEVRIILVVGGGGVPPGRRRAKTQTARGEANLGQGSTLILLADYHIAISAIIPLRIRESMSS